MKLSIGMAVFDDFNGVYFTVQALRFQHAAALRSAPCELIVVDNHPESKQGKDVADFLGWVNNHEFASVRYIPMPEPVGTSAPRDRIFREARGEAVLVIDAHVLLAPGALKRLLDFYAGHPGAADLYHGPMLLNDLQSFHTHFDAAPDGSGPWRSEMLGTWATDQRGADPNAEPFEIPACGLGLFTCRRDAWLGFPPELRGFGGEEIMVHMLYRQAGRKVLCLPFLQWTHRFGRPGGVPYPLSQWNKVRNYVIWHNKLGIPLDGIHEHFVQSGKMCLANWDYLVADPIAHVTPPGQKAGGGCGGAKRPQPTENCTLEEAFAWGKAQPRDIDQHFDRFRKLASEAGHVTAMVKRREWDLALLAGWPKTLRVFTMEPDPLHETLKKLAGEATDYLNQTGDPLAMGEIEETDLLVIHTIHQADRVYAELSRFAPRVRRRILLFATATFGERGEPDGPGLLPGMRKFLREHPEWTAVEHERKQWGYTLLSRDPADKPALPSLPKMAWNFAKALAKHAAAGRKTADEATVDARLAICATCPQRTGNRCSACGCYLDVRPDGGDGKAIWPESECSLGYWPAPVKEVAA